MAELRDILNDGSITTINLGGVTDNNSVLTRGTVYPVKKIIVGEENSDFVRVKDAMDSIVGSSISNRYIISVAPGIYVEQNPIVAKPYVTVVAEGIHSAEIVANNPNLDLFSGAEELHLVGFSLKGVVGTTNYALNHSIAGETTIKDCILTDCSNGILVNNVGAEINILNCDIHSVVLPTTIGINIQSGTAIINSIKVISTSTISTVLQFAGTNTNININHIKSQSPNVTTAISTTAGCAVIGSAVDIGLCVDGLVISGNNTNVKLDALKIIDVTGDGIRADNSGTNVRLTILSTTVTGSGINNINILNPNIIIAGSGFSELNKFSIVNGAKFYAYIVDIVAGDEGVNVLGELHVGSPENPAEAVFGEGDSYTHDMLVYTYDGATYIDISYLASGNDGQTFTFPNANVGTAIYFASTKNNGEDFIKHYGIKLKQTKPGGGVAWDVQVTGITSPTTAAGDYDRRSLDYNNNPVYVRKDGLYWIFNKQGFWCMNDTKPESTGPYFNANYISQSLESTYTGIGVNTGTPEAHLGEDASLKYIRFEYYNELSLIWEPLDTMVSMSDSPYMPLGENALHLTGSTQIRYDAAIKDDPWGKTDDMVLGTSYYWIRAIIETQMAVIPEFDQIKLHSNRMELNGDGWPEYFGTARPIAALAWDLGMLEPANSSPANQDLFVSDKLGVGRKENRLVKGATDRLGLNAYLPLELDTSTGIYLRYSFIGSDINGGDVKFVVRWGYTSDGYSVYTSTTNAPTTGINEKTISLIHTMPLGNQSQNTIQLKLGITELVSRRFGSDNVGFGDTIWITVERPSNDATDTYIGDVSLINLQPLHVKWCDGGHI